MTDKAYPEVPKAHLPRGGFPDLYTADQLAAAVAAERISALCDTLLNRPARKLRGNRAEDCSRHPRREKGEQS